MKSELPLTTVAVLGAGPIGLAAAAHLLERGFSPLVFESGPSVASHLESYRHVRLFSPWQYNIDTAAARLLAQAGWTPPPPEVLPTAGAVIDEYLQPLATLTPLRSAVRFGHHVTRVTREGFDKMRSTGRNEAPFVIRARTSEGEQEFRAWAVIDATGTWGRPNPMGANGVPAIGETEASSRIAYGMPDILGTERSRFAGKSVLVVGAGHSAAGSLLALAELAEQDARTRISWTIRGHHFARIFGGGENDGLAARGALGTRLKSLAESGRLSVHADFRTERILATSAGLVIEGRGADGTPRRIDAIDQIVVSAGGRPDLTIAAELRLRIDPAIECTEALAPLIDPNVHSCGTVRPHGHRELAHPDARFYSVGAKSYGRAPNFLLATGHEQARSVVAALAGDFAAADDVQLVLPETGVCSTQFDESAALIGCCEVTEKPLATAAVASCATSGCAAPKKVAETSCCGGAPVARADACCVKDEEAKNAGREGCGCSEEPAVAVTTAR